jgi:peptidoglycan/LPS O-acetylase OafA/YrhL
MSSGRVGSLGVCVFFVISGFILPYALRRSGYNRSDYPRFVWKRVLRLDPPYLACIALTIFLNYVSALAPNFQGPPFQFRLGPTLLHLGYLNALFHYDWILGVFWTLAIEFQFYLIVGLVFPLVNHDSPRIRAGICVLLAASALLFTSGNLVFHYMFLFLIGITAFQIKSGLLRGVLAHVAGWLLLAAGAWYTLDAPSAIAGTATGMFITYGHLNSRPLLFLGQISYSLYLLHVPIGGRLINLGSRYATQPFEAYAVLILACSVNIVAAYMFYRWVERPAQRLSSAVRFAASNATAG